MTSPEMIVVCLCGPSGVGKSQLAKAVVTVLGDDNCARIPGDNYLVPADEPLAGFLEKPLQYDWQLIRQVLRSPIGTIRSIPQFDFDSLTRLSDCGGASFVVRQIMVIDAMNPLPEAKIKILVTAPGDVRRARIVERDTRWGAKVIERWDNLEITWQHAEAISESWDLVLDGTQSLDENATTIAQFVTRIAERSRNQCDAESTFQGMGDEDRIRHPPSLT